MSSINPIASPVVPAQAEPNEIQKNRIMMNQSGVLDINAQTEQEAIKKLSQEFESVFLGLVLKSMRDTVPKSGLIDGGNGEAVFSSMLDTEYAKAMSKQGSAGLSEMIEKQLLGTRSQVKVPVSPTALQTYQDLALKR